MIGFKADIADRAGIRFADAKPFGQSLGADGHAACLFIAHLFIAHVRQPRKMSKGSIRSTRRTPNQLDTPAMTTTMPSASSRLP